MVCEHIADNYAQVLYKKNNAIGTIPKDWGTPRTWQAKDDKWWNSIQFLTFQHGTTHLYQSEPWQKVDYAPLKQWWGVRITVTFLLLPASPIGTFTNGVSMSALTFISKIKKLVGHALKKTILISIHWWIYWEKFTYTVTLVKHTPGFTYSLTSVKHTPGSLNLPGPSAPQSHPLVTYYNTSL